MEDFGGPSMPTVPPPEPPPPPPRLPPLAATVSAPADQAQAQAKKAVAQTGRATTTYTSPMGVVTPGRNVGKKTLLGA